MVDHLGVNQREMHLEVACQCCSSFTNFHCHHGGLVLGGSMRQLIEHSDLASRMIGHDKTLVSPG